MDGFDRLDLGLPQQFRQPPLSRRLIGQPVPPSSHPRAKRIIYIFIFLFFLSSIFMFILALPASINPLSDLHNLLFSIYWVIGLYYTILLFSDAALKEYLRSFFNSHSLKLRLCGVFVIVHYATLMLSLYPMLSVVGWLGFRRTKEKLLQYSVPVNKIDFINFPFIREVSDSDIIKARVTFVICNLIAVYILLFLKSIIWPSRGLTVLILCQVTAVATLIVKNIISGIDLRTLAKQRRGPVVLNLIQIIAFIVLNGIIASSLVDVKTILLRESLLMSFIEILYNNALLFIDLNTLIKYILTPSANMWKAIFFALVYYYVLEDLIDLKVWKNWRRGPQDLAYLSSRYLAVGNYPKAEHTIKKLIDSFESEFHVPSEYYVMLGFAVLGIGDIEGARRYLAKVPIPQNQALQGPPDIFWIAAYYVKKGDFKEALISLLMLRQYNAENPRFHQLISRLRSQIPKADLAAFDPVKTKEKETLHGIRSVSEDGSSSNQSISRIIYSNKIKSDYFKNSEIVQFRNERRCTNCDSIVDPGLLSCQKCGFGIFYYPK